jgi:8-oxo-dGTP diphosphatase
MSLPYNISTLLYCFNERDEVLLMRRVKEPNKGLWSPCGGKLDTRIGESPFGCACREAKEEIGLDIDAHDLHLTGIVSEQAYKSAGHWLMFLFEIKSRLTEVPPDHREGYFQFHRKDSLSALPLPQTDAEKIWPLFWEHRGGFFAAHCACGKNGVNAWTIEASFRQVGPAPNLLA